VIVELRGVELHGHHGVLPDEQEHGQPFVYDVELEVGDRGADDRIDHAVDYRLVGEAIREVNGRRVDLLEALATALADELMRRFEPSWVRVRVRKPRVRLDGLTLEHSAVTVERP
jgi:7,8-dihydroneopterin aldolase/epimerase/oxygenase